MLFKQLSRISLHRLYSTQERAVRVRFAPSPTGFLHIGSIRSALYNYLFALKTKGTFILRVEDTDQERTVPGAREALEDVLQWAGLTPHESPRVGGDYGPYIQSQRFQLYQEKANQLLESGHAYRCFCSETRLDLKRKEALKNREIPRYDKKCRHLSGTEVQQKLDNGELFTIRLKLTEGDLVFDDAIYGKISIDLSKVESDPIILKSDNFPTYHLANVIDDHLMKISHVLRGVEWQKSTPKHLMLYEAFGWEPPIYGHLPLIVNTDGTKLSKRQNDIRIEAIKQEGYFPEAIINYLKMIGGGFGKQVTDEILSMEEMASTFSLEKINTNSAKLDPKRFILYNRLALERRMNDDMGGLIKVLRQDIRRLIGQVAEESLKDDYLQDILRWSKDRVHFLKDLTTEFAFLWNCPSFDWEQKKFQKLGSLDTVLEDTICLLEELASLEMSHIDKMEAYKLFCAERNLNYAKYLQLLRAATTNAMEGPPVREIMTLLGPERFQDYLQRAANYVKSNNESKSIERNL